MKKILNAVIMTAASLLLFCVTAHAENNIYKVGVINDYNYTGNDLSVYAHSCLETLFSYDGGRAFELTDCTTDTGTKSLESGEVRFLVMVPKNSSVSDNISLTDRPIATGFLSLFAKNDKKLYYNDFNRLNGANIAMLPNPYFEGLLQSFAVQNGFSYTPVYCSSLDEMNAAIENGSADAILSPAAASPENMRLIAKCGQLEYYCAVHKDDLETLASLNNLIIRLSEDSPFYLAEGYLKVFRLAYRDMIPLTESDYRAAQNKRVLRVYVDDTYPVSFYNENEGKYDGIYIGMLEKIAAGAGLELEYIPKDFTNKDELIENMSLGKADVLLTVSGSTQGVIEATDPYTSLSFYPVSTKPLDEDESLSVGITNDNLWIREYLDIRYPQWSVSSYDSIDSLLSAAEGGRLDAALISVPALQTETSLIVHPNLSIRQEFALNIPVCLGISKTTCTPQVVTMMNGIIRNTSLEQETLESRIYTLSHTYVPNFRDMLYANKYWFMAILIIVLIIILLLALRIHRLRIIARIDWLTGIYNSTYFFRRAVKLLKKNSDKNYLLASVDAVNFKLVNDRFGLNIGDQTLKEIASSIRDIFKDKALYGRLEADAFLVLAENTRENRGLMDEIEKMDIRVHDSSNYRVNIKTGVCPIENYRAETPLSIYIDRANIAKESGEGTGKSYLRYFTGKMNEQLEIESELEVDMTAAMRRGEFIAYYQPKYDLKTNRIVGAEALVRWNHKERGLISPGIFVPLFERNGFIKEVDFCVYEHVLRLLKKRLINNLPVVTVSVNVSRSHLTDKNFAEKFETLVDKYKIPKKHIDAEITESIFSEGDKSANELVYDMKRRGFTVSMDDFGSGYSSLNLLRVMPIDTLKIDKVFIEDIETSDKSLAIIEEILAMAEKIDVKTICEGIETEKQRDILREAGCDMAQGYYYSKPLTEEDFEKLLDMESQTESNNKRK